MAVRLLAALSLEGCSGDPLGSGGPPVAPSDAGLALDLAPPACRTDGVQDELESDIDCGGPLCRACGVARHCLSDHDCASARCGPDHRCARLALSFSPTVVPTKRSDGAYLFTGDFNGDGIVDLAASEQVEDIRILLGRGDGTFAMSAVLPPSFVRGAADFDGDGLTDLVAMLDDGRGLQILQNEGSLAFSAQPPLYDRGLGDGAIDDLLAIADIDADGRLDILAWYRHYTGWLATLHNPAPRPGAWPAAQWPIGAGQLPVAGALGDADGDGLPDVVSYEASSSTLRPLLDLLPGRGDGTFGIPRPMPFAYPVANVAIADVDGDRRPDLIVAGTSTASDGSRAIRVMALLATAAPGAWIDAVPLGLDPQYVGLTALDFDNDGNVDLLRVGSYAIGLEVLLGDGKGSFARPQRFPDAPAILGPIYSSVAADFNRDGKVDVAVSYADDGKVGGFVTVFLNTSN